MNEQQKQEFIKSILSKLNYYGLTPDDLKTKNEPKKETKKPKKQ